MPARNPLPKRADSTNDSKAAILVVVVLAILLFLAILAYIVLKSLRKRHATPTYVPTQFLKRKWEAWNPARIVSKGNYSARLQENDSVPTLHPRSARTSTYNLGEVEQQGGVDRHASVRSVLTLPAYSRSVRENERVLGREGERGGVDTVLEHPETVEEEEQRREGEMESLYQIRVQRRQEIEERNARREERRAARARGDTVTLERLRREAAQRASDREQGGSAAMIAQHQSRSRDRRVSSVSYAELGVARHDGTRIRANSNDSDNRPLLDSAASMSGRTATSTQGRGRSASSVLSVSDASDYEGELPPFAPATDLEIVTLNQVHSRNGSRTHTPLANRSRASSYDQLQQPPPLDTSVDIADHSIVPSAEPPSYQSPDGFEDVPPYTSPVETRAPQRISTISESASPANARQTSSQTGAPMLPQFERLPSIRIAAATPVEPSTGVEWPSPNRDSRR